MFTFDFDLLACAKHVETVENPPFDWLKVREALRTKLGSEVIGRWIEPLHVGIVEAERIVLEAPNQFFRDWVASHYLDVIQTLVSGRAVQIVAIASPSGPSDTVTEVLDIIAAAQQRTNQQQSRPTPSTGSASSWEKPLNQRFSFDKFVVGPSNRFAHAASMAVSESPAKAYNPLFIYGAVGLGKTHLMQAIGHAIVHRWPNKRIVFLSSEGFTNELITSIQTKQTARFRERYRTVDILLIDDIQFIAGKEATQEEFFHTFNALYDAHKQIVMSSDRSPKDIPGLEERLVSRFEWGLVTDIQPPDFETRIAILRKKAEEAKIQVADDVTQFIAKQITSNIRELEGALIRVVAYCNFSNKPQTVAVAHEVLKDMVKEVSSRVTIETIQKRVADYFQVDLGEIRGARRHRSVLYPRQVAMFLCRRLTESSLPEIGRAFGGRDHTTVMHAVEKIDNEITQDTHKKQVVDHLNQLVMAGAQRPMV